MASGPQAVVAAFCRDDALGARTEPRRYAPIADRVAWPLEPAWDHAVLVRGYEVGDADPVEPGIVEVEVLYSVVGEVSARGYDVEARVELQRFRVGFDDGRWRILGPPLPPHLFANRVDPERLRLELGGDHGYLSQSRFVAEAFRAAGWPVAAETLEEIAAGRTYAPVASPRAGDLALFRTDAGAYHIGIVETPGVIVSATLGRGVMRHTPATFAGAVEYRRLVAPAAPRSIVEDEPLGRAEPAAAE